MSINLSMLYELIEERINKSMESNFIENPEKLSYDDSMSNLRIMATKGDLKARNYLKNQIYFTLGEMNELVNFETIDQLLAQYHIDYYVNIFYRHEIENESNYLCNNYEKFTISSSSTFDEKLLKLTQIVYQELYGFGIIDELIFDGEFNEVACNRFDYIWVQFEGVKSKISNPNFRFADEKTYNSLVDSRFTITAKEELNAGNPLSYSVLLNGTRVTALRPPISKSFTVNFRNFIAINKKSDKTQKLLGKKISRLLELLVCKGRRNVAIIGEQSAGKTTAADELIISKLSDSLGIGLAENIHELNISGKHPNKNVVELQYTKNFRPSDITEIFFRLNRDITILGEVRGSDEALEMIKAMLRQARGSFFTFHSSGVNRMIHDLRQLLMQTSYYKSFLEAQFDVADAVDLAIHIKLDRSSGKRYIYKISEIIANGRDMSFEVIDLCVFDKSKGMYGIRKEGIGKSTIESCMEYEMDEKDKHEILDLFSISGEEKNEFFYL